jgi:allantoinase
MPALSRFLDHVQGFDDVWICNRDSVARHWIAKHPYAAGD